MRLLPCLSLLAATSLHAWALDWPQWRGPDRNDLSKETGLLKAWPEGGPRKVWTFDQAGLGYAGFAVVSDRLYTMGLFGSEERLLCLDALTGKQVWSQPIGGHFKNDWGDGPRGTPSVHGGKVYAIGAEGDIICADAAKGSIVWRNRMSELGGKVPNWGYAESPLVLGKTVIVTPGGPKGTLAALDLETGKVVWQSAEFTDPAHYSSAIAATHNGVTQVIQLVEKNFVGVNAENGKLLWKHEWPGRTAVIPTPIFHQGKVFVTTGYGVGAKVISIQPDNSTQQVWMNKNMKNHHGGVILLDGHLYGYSDGIGWACLDFGTGEITWSNKDALGKGAIAYADGMFYLQDEGSGDIALIKATTEGWAQTGRFKLSPQTTQRKPQGRIWTHPVIVNGKLYLRDQEFIHCHDVKAR